MGREGGRDKFRDGQGLEMQHSTRQEEREHFEHKDSAGRGREGEQTPASMASLARANMALPQFQRARESVGSRSAIARYRVPASTRAASASSRRRASSLASAASAAGEEGGGVPIIASSWSAFSFPTSCRVLPQFPCDIIIMHTYHSSIPFHSIYLSYIFPVFIMIMHFYLGESAHLYTSL